MPSCVNTCPARARVFGDINKPDSEISRLVASAKVAKLLPEQGTKPFVFYLGGDLGAFTSHRGSETT
jgi:Fe-S-cluster-containing dehydrogenase component